MTDIDRILAELGAQPVYHPEPATTTDPMLQYLVTYSAFGIGIPTIAYAVWRYRSLLTYLCPTYSCLTCLHTRFQHTVRSNNLTGTTESSTTVQVELMNQSNVIIDVATLGLEADQPVISPPREVALTPPPLAYLQDFRNLDFD